MLRDILDAEANEESKQSALWREELSAIADALCAKIARLRAAQRLSRGDRLKRISPALKDSVRRLLRAAGNPLRLRRRADRWSARMSAE